MTTAMTFDADHKLKLFKFWGGSNAGILLDPVASSIKIDGQPVLTTASASTQYVGKTATGVNLAQSGGILRTQSGLPPQLVLGKFNDNRTVDGFDRTQGVLIVGSGSGSGLEPRKNGLRILDDGTVLILPKADLPMAAEFQNGPRP